MYDAFQELEDISNNLMKAKMSSFRKDESQSPTDRELRFQQLQQRLNKVNGNIYIYLLTHKTVLMILNNFSTFCVFRKLKSMRH